MPRPKKIKTPEVEVLDVADIMDESSQETGNDDVQLTYRSGVKNTSFDIFAGTKALRDKSQKLGAFKTMDEIATDYLPVPWMALQYLIGRVGIPMKTIVEFIGAEGTGKSSIVGTLIGNFVTHNIPCYYINSEAKVLEPDWRMRLYHRDPAMSEKIDSVVNYDYISTLSQMKDRINSWIEAQREVIPVDVPLVIAVDSITKLMNDDEAAAAGWDSKTESFAYGKAKDVSKKPGVTAKWMHEWSRFIAPILQTNNVTLILVSGQNQDMNSQPSPFIPASAIAKRNKTRTGGNAINQSAALQFTLTKMSDAKRVSTAKASGKNVCIYTAKNSYGPTGREVTYTVWDNRKENFEDSDVPGKYMASPIDMDVTLCNLLLDSKVFGLTVTANKFTSEELELFKVTAADVVRAIYAKPANVLKASKALSIYGYQTA